MKEVTKYPNCFVCGDKNEIGLKAKFFYDGKEVKTSVITMEKFEGYNGIYHGGIISTILDEVMIKAILALDKFAVTAEMTIKYLQPAKIGENLTFRGRIVSSKGRLFKTEGLVENSNGELLAKATGKYLEAKTELRSQLTKSLVQE